MSNPILDNYIKLIFKDIDIANVNEIIISKPYESIIKTNNKWQTRKNELDSLKIENFLMLLSKSRKKLFNKQHPILKTSLPNSNIRVYAMHSTTLANQDFQINIRIPSQQILDISKFRLASNLGYSYEDIVEFIEKKKNIIIAGSTGSGKTSLLNSLIQNISKDDRVVTIEDSSEIKIDTISRTSIIVDDEDKDTIFKYSNAMNSAQRLSPDRLLLGELDNRNTYAFLRLNNTGHKGNITTLHVNFSDDNLEQEVKNALMMNILLEHKINENYLEKFISSAIDYVIYINKYEIIKIIDFHHYQNNHIANILKEKEFTNEKI